MNKEVTKQKKNVSEKVKIKKALDSIKEEKGILSRQPFYWRKSSEPLAYPKDLRNPTRH